MRHSLNRIKDGLENLVAGLGTERDKRSYSFYTPNNLSQNFQQLEALYQSSWLAKRIVNIIPEDMTREWVDVNIIGDDEFDFTPISIKYRIRERVREALQWARLYGGAFIVLGVNDNSNSTSSKNLERPLTENDFKQGCLNYLHVLNRWQLSPGADITLDITSPNFDCPEYYHLVSSSNVKSLQAKIHHTRLLRFDGQKLPYNLWINNGRFHDSELAAVIESIKHYDTVAGGIASMIFEANLDVIKSPEIGELLSTEGGEKQLIKRFQLSQLMKSFNRTLLLDKEEEYEKKTNSFANLHDIWDRFMDDVCGAAEIPRTRLFGQSPGGLNASGESDLTTYYDSISNKQESQIYTQVDTLIRIAIISEMGAYPDDLNWEFKPLWQMSEKERSEIEKINADRDSIYYNMGVITEAQVASELMIKGVYKSITAEDITALEELEGQVEEIPKSEEGEEGKTGLPGAEKESEEDIEKLNNPKED